MHDRFIAMVGNLSRVEDVAPERRVRKNIIH
jgi:hypothetical protein